MTDIKCSYNLDTYKKILFDGYDYKLPENVLEIVKNLTMKFQNDLNELNHHANSQERVKKSNTYENAEYNRKYNSSNNRNKHSSTVLSDEDWANLRNFKSTKIEKKEGTEKLINDIRVCLNKISEKNYEIQKEEIFGLIEKIMSEESSSSDDETIKSPNTNINKVACIVFEIASNNKFYSEIYANLYKELLVKYNVFNDIIEKYINQYKESINNIQYIEPNTDYDKYCDYNKINDKRKSLSLFFGNLMRKDIISKSQIIDIILSLQDMVFTYINTKNKQNEVEEITENLFLLITTVKSDCVMEEKWATILSNVLSCSQMKSKEKESLSSRAIFKYMDLMDALKK
jgi:hypothetical protein